MNTRHAVFFDIDGTIWDYKCEIPRSTIQAIHALRKNGHYAFLCSGRSRGAIVEKKLYDIGFDGLIAGGGTYIEIKNYNNPDASLTRPTITSNLNTDDIIYEKIIPYNEVCRVKKRSEEKNLAYIFEGRDAIYVDVDTFKDDSYVAFLKESLGEHFKTGLEIDENSNINKLSVDSKFTNAGVQPIYEVYGDNPDNMFGYEIIKHEFADYAEIMPKNHTKATGIEKVCDYLSIPVEYTYAFGDSANDIDMLKYVNCGIAMGGGANCAKEAADFVTDSLYENGIYNALIKFGLI